MEKLCEVQDKSSIRHLFEGWQETMIWSCLDNCMGKAETDNPEQPCSARILIADFCFLAGVPSEELLRFESSAKKPDFLIMVPQTRDWDELIEKMYGPGAIKRERYAIKKEGNIFDREKLRKIVSEIPKEYELKIIDEKLYEQIRRLPWAGDLCSQFKTYETYRNCGIGAAVLKDGEIVSGASSYTVYQKGIEIEIDTREDMRRRGLALICGAKLILECLDRGLYPSWDAHNMGSVLLAEKLGYHFAHAYPVYEVQFGRQSMGRNEVIEEG